MLGLARVLSPGALTAIVNTADDEEIYGVHVAPDIDTVTYWLAGIADRDRGWGIRGDTFHVVNALEELGGDCWFRLGDRDLATCMFRTARLRGGAALSQVTAEICAKLQVATRIIPMTDQRVRTQLTATDGRLLDFQEYFVKERHQTPIEAVEFTGAEAAVPAPGAVEAIEAADVVVLCPSNPIVSIGPILAVDGFRSALAAHPRVVAVSPIVRGSALKGPAADLLAMSGRESSASGAASVYEGICNVFIVDSTDEGELEHIEALGIDAVALPTIMTDQQASIDLARALLQHAIRRAS